MDLQTVYLSRNSHPQYTRNSRSWTLKKQASQKVAWSLNFSKVIEMANNMWKNILVSQVSEVHPYLSERASCPSSDVYYGKDKSADRAPKLLVRMGGNEGMEINIEPSPSTKNVTLWFKNSANCIYIQKEPNHYTLHSHDFCSTIYDC